MPENYPGVTFNEEGVCNLCQHFDKHWGAWVESAERKARSEAELRRIFAAAKRKGKPYDALLGISGGKDSSYSLYLCHKVYGLKLLTFTKDGGFLSDEAESRIEQLVKAYGVPHFYYQDPLAPELAAVFMRKTGNFCAPCELATFDMSAVICREYDIPLLIVGSSSRTEAGAPKVLNPWDPWYFANVTRDEPYRERIRCSFYGRNYLIREGIARVLGKRRIVLLPDYLEWDEDEICELFKREFGFDFGEEHSDCWATGVAGYLYRRKLANNNPRVAKYSLFVRTGKMTRAEALEHLGRSDGNLPPPNLDRFLKVTGMTHEEFEAASERSPLPYATGLSKLINHLRKRIRRQAV
jgi:hypothetical protein